MSKLETELKLTAIRTLYDECWGNEALFIPRMAHYYAEHQKLSGEEARKNAEFDFLLWDAAQRLSPDEFEKVRKKIERVLMRRPDLELVKGGREDGESEL